MIAHYNAVLCKKRKVSIVLLLIKIICLFSECTPRKALLGTGLQFSISRGKHTMAAVPKPSSSVKGMTVLDRGAFNSTCTVPAVSVNLPKIGSAVKILKKYLFHLPKVMPVFCCESDTERKLILLNPSIVTEIDDLPCDVVEVLRDKCEISLDTAFTHQTLKLTYENWTYDSVFRAVLPEDKEKLSGYSRIGHILHLNLKEHLLDYKTLIGKYLFQMILRIFAKIISCFCLYNM